MSTCLTSHPPFIKRIMYASLGVLAGLLLMGTLWDIFIRKKRRSNQNIVVGENEYFMAKLKMKSQSC